MTFTQRFCNSQINANFYRWQIIECKFNNMLHLTLRNSNEKVSNGHQSLSQVRSFFHPSQFCVIFGNNSRKVKKDVLYHFAENRRSYWQLLSILSFYRSVVSSCSHSSMKKKNAFAKLLQYNDNKTLKDSTFIVCMQSICSRTINRFVQFIHV